jgi:ribosome-binding factor A
MPGDVKRAVRVAERVREELAREVRGLSDRRTSGVLITRVEMTDDLQTARVYVRLEMGGDAALARTNVVKALSGATGRLRREVTRAVGLRYAPELRFFYDEGQDAAQRVEELLREIQDEDASASKMAAPKDDGAARERKKSRNE